MAVQETEKETWSHESLLESARDSISPGSDEKPVKTPNKFLEASSTAIRSVQHGFCKVSSVSVRLYRHSWPKVSSASVRLYERGWPKVRSRTVRIYQHVSPKVSSASVRLYQRTWPKVSSTAFQLSQHDDSETSLAQGPLPHRARLEIASMTLRLFQLLSALYVFMSVTESFRSKITYDGRIRQIQPMLLITLIYSSLAIVCFLLLNLVKKLRASAWHIVAISSVPGDVSMTCLFIAKDVIFGVHSFECAAASGTISAIKQYATLQDMNPLELRSFLDNKPSAGLFIGSTRDSCLLSSSVYVAFLYWIGDRHRPPVPNLPKGCFSCGWWPISRPRRASYSGDYIVGTSDGYSDGTSDGTSDDPTRTLDVRTHPPEDGAAGTTLQRRTIK
ncbi:hypothetical protein CONLIGDRAFT_80673 [Coniochaeta ligniaria NRRL 30616]|uniref:Uncharacterized protein n=1 Tax=Coniochaeta ligniaria NRRL 30616 TaxID=1408157 RepID=A0A1J7IBK5_9PEZI|nr:hypothetical protein CONLIGDRAFT_80673 [Coniochaeta ligniaria NRRL 30616]